MRNPFKHGFLKIRNIFAYLHLGFVIMQTYSSSLQITSDLGRGTINSYCISDLGWHNRIEGLNYNYLT